MHSIRSAARRVMLDASAAARACAPMKRDPRCGFPEDRAPSVLRSDAFNALFRSANTRRSSAEQVPDAKATTAVVPLVVSYPWDVTILFEL